MAVRIGLFARLVGDDQLFLSAQNGRLRCTAPETIAGLVEVRGLGPTAMEFEAATIVDLHVRLAADGTAPRFAEAVSETLEGCVVKSLVLAGRGSARRRVCRSGRPLPAAF